MGKRVSMGTWAYAIGPYADRPIPLCEIVERLSELAVCSALWLPVPESDDVTVIVQNGPTHRYYVFGQIKQPAPPEMRRVLDTGEPVRVPAAEGDKFARSVSDFNVEISRLGPVGTPWEVD